ncbi:hypothetical protein ES703_10158 [subsurface metagenome]
MDTKKWHVLIRFDFIGNARQYRYKTRLAEALRQNFIRHHSRFSNVYQIENVEVTVTKPK